MKKNKIYIIISLIVVAGGLILYFIGRKASSIQQAPLPEENETIDAAAVAKIRRIANALHEDMDGVNWINRDKAIYKEMLSLSNSIFVSVYNDFNKLFEAENKGTLKQWIEDEYFFNFVTGASLEFRSLKNALIERFNTLNLK